MFGTAPRMPRPVLLVLVYGIFLMIVGVTAVAQTFMVSASYSQTTMQSIVSTDAALIRSFVNGAILPSDLQGSLTPDRRAELEAAVSLLVARTEIEHVDVFRPDGTIVVGDRPGSAGTRPPVTSDFRAAVDTPSVAASFDEGLENSVLHEYFPLQSGARVHAVVRVTRDATPILAELDSLRTNIVLTTLSAAIVAAFVLWMVFRSARAASPNRPRRSWRPRGATR